MLVRQFTQKQINTAIRGNKFSVLSLAEEFPHKAPAAKAAAAPVVSTTTINGARFIVRQRESPVATIKFAVVGGSSVETAAQKGAAQFLAAAAYSGDKNNSALRTIKQLEKLGVKYSAEADREKIVYTATFAADQAAEVLKTYLSILASPAADTDFLEEYRETAKVGYDAFHGCSRAQVLELVHEAAFGETSPLGSSFYSNHVTLSDVLQYRAQHFVAQNLIVAADGVSADVVKAVAEPLLSLFPAGKATALPGSAYTGGESRVRVDLGGRTHVAVGFPVPAGAAGKATHVVHSLLTAQLAAKKIAAQPFLFSYTSGGLFGFTVKGKPANIESTLSAAIDELKAIANGGVEGHAVGAAKNRVSVANFATLESTNGTGNFVHAAVTNHAAGELADVRGVSAADVSAAAKAALKAQTAYAVYGATAGTPSHSTVSKLLA